MQLWSGTLSPFSAKVRMALAEMQLEYQLLDVPWTRQTRWEPKPPAFLKASLRGEVPVLIVDDLCINDSTVILEYLADAYPERALLPTGAEDRAQARMLEDQADHLLAGAVVTLISEVFLKPDGIGRDIDAVSAAEKALAGYQSRLNAMLAGQDYLMPLAHQTDTSGASSADIASFVCLGFAQTLGIALAPEHASLQQWWQRMLARPAIGGDFNHMMQSVAAVA